MKRKPLVTVVGIGLSVSLLSGCASQFSYKEQLAQKEEAMTGLKESTLPNNPYADKVEKENQSHIRYYASKELAEKYPNKKWTQAELAKLDKQYEQSELAEQKPTATVKTNNPKTVVVVQNTDSKSHIQQGSMAEAIEKTKIQQEKIKNSPTWKVDPTNDKEQGVTLSQLVDQLNAERAMNGLPPIEVD